MKAIVTKVKGPTNSKGSRMIATDNDGNRISIPYRGDESLESNHVNACIAFNDKFNFYRMADGMFEMGSIGKGQYAHLFIEGLE